MSTWGFKDNLTIDNGRYLKWLDPNGLSNDLIGVVGYDFHISSVSNGNIHINNSGDGYTFINKDNPFSTFIESKTGIGFSNTSGAYADLTIVQNGWVGTHSDLDNGFLGISGNSKLNGSGGSYVLLYGNNNTSYKGALELHAGNNTGGNINMYTRNESLKMQILSEGIVNFQPDGSTIQFSVTDPITSVNNQFNLTSTESSTSSTTGAIVVSGGAGIKGDVYIDGSLNINSVTGSINFDSFAQSTSYSTGAITISGGMGIACSTNATSETSGGAMSIAGGVAIGKNMYIGGDVVLKGTTASTTSQNGSLIVNGGIGVSGNINTRSTSSNQITLTPVINNAPVGLNFNYTNNYTTAGSWFVGQSGGNFIINSLDYGDKVIVESSNVSINGSLSANNFTLPSTQGSYLAWNRESGSGLTAMINNRGLGTGGFEFLIYDTGSNLVNTPMFIGPSNVGINTTSPSYTLEINGSLYAQSITLGSLAVSSISGFGSFEIGGPSGAYLDLKTPFSDDYDFRIISETSGSKIISNTTAGTFSIIVNDNQNIFITTSGNVCINSTSSNSDSSLNVSGILDTQILRISNLFDQSAGAFTTASGVTTESIATGLLFQSETIRSFKTTLIIVGDNTGGNTYTQMNIEGIQTSTGWEYQENFIGDSPPILFTMNTSGQMLYTTFVTGNVFNKITYDKTSYFII